MTEKYRKPFLLWIPLKKVRKAAQFLEKSPKKRRCQDLFRLFFRKLRLKSQPVRSRQSIRCPRILSGNLMRIRPSAGI